MSYHQYFARSVSFPTESQAVIALQLRLRAEGLSEAVQKITKPLRVLRRCAVQPESPDSHRYHLHVQQPALPRIYFHQIHKRQVAAELLIAGNPLIVGQEIAAPVKDQSLSIDFDGLHVVRGVAVNDRDAFINEPMREADLLIRNAVAPIAAPMDRSHNHGAGLCMLTHLSCDAPR